MLGLLGFLMPAGKVKGAVAIHLTLMDVNMEDQVVDPTLEAAHRAPSSKYQAWILRPAQMKYLWLKLLKTKEDNGSRGSPC